MPIPDTTNPVSVDLPDTRGTKSFSKKKTKMQTPNSELPETAVHVSAVEPSILTEWRKIREVKRHDDAPQSHEHRNGSAGTQGDDIVRPERKLSIACNTNIRGNKGERSIVPQLLHVDQSDDVEA